MARLGLGAADVDLIGEPDHLTEADALLLNLFDDVNLVAVDAV